MTETLTKIIIDCSTGEALELPLTPEEIAQREIDVAQAEADRLARGAEEQRIADLKASAKAKLIAGQPLTAEEAETIVL